METFSALLVFCEGSPAVTGGFPSQRPVTRSFHVFFDLCLNKRLCKNRDAGDLRRHRSHYEVSVMTHHLFNLAKAVFQTNHHRLEKIIYWPNILGVIHKKVILQERLVIQPWKHLWRFSHIRPYALNPEQNGWHFSNDICKGIILKKKQLCLFSRNVTEAFS